MNFTKHHLLIVFIGNTSNKAKYKRSRVNLNIPFNNNYFEFNESGLIIVPFRAEVVVSHPAERKFFLWIWILISFRFLTIVLFYIFNKSMNSITLVYLWNYIANFWVPYKCEFLQKLRLQWSLRFFSASHTKVTFSGRREECDIVVNAYLYRKVMNVLKLRPTGKVFGTRLHTPRTFLLPSHPRNFQGLRISICMGSTCKLNNFRIYLHAKYFLALRSFNICWQFTAAAVPASEFI